MRGLQVTEVLIFSHNKSRAFSANFETDFINSVTNKTNLNKYLAQKFLKLDDNNNQIRCVTYNDTVISSDNNALTEILITIFTKE